MEEYSKCFCFHNQAFRRSLSLKGEKDYESGYRMNLKLSQDVHPVKLEVRLGVKGRPQSGPEPSRYHNFPDFSLVIL